MNTKAIFLDLDGTLLNDKKEITAGNRAAINKALELGHRVIINTGRPLASAKKLAALLELDKPGCYIVSFNGGMIYDYGAAKVIYKKEFPIALVSPVMAEATRRGLHAQTYDQKEVIVEPSSDDDFVRFYTSTTMMTYHVIDSVKNLEEAPVKCLFISTNHEELDEFRQWVVDTYPGELDSFFSSQTYLEVVKSGLNKGNALRQLSELIGIAPENTIACGDEANDLTMIEAAHLGVAMKNAIPSVKEIAQYITENDNNHDGIAEVIEKFML